MGPGKTGGRRGEEELASASKCPQAEGFAVAGSLSGNRATAGSGRPLRRQPLPTLDSSLFAVRGERKIWIEAKCDDLFSSRHRIPRRKRRHGFMESRSGARRSCERWWRKVLPRGDRRVVGRKPPGRESGACGHPANPPDIRSPDSSFRWRD